MENMRLNLSDRKHFPRFYFPPLFFPSRPMFWSYWTSAIAQCCHVPLHLQAFFHAVSMPVLSFLRFNTWQTPSYRKLPIRKNGSLCALMDTVCISILMSIFLTCNCLYVYLSLCVASPEKQREERHSAKRISIAKKCWWKQLDISGYIRILEVESYRNISVCKKDNGDALE